MTTIDVACELVADGWTCSVTATDATGSSRHQVTVAADVLERLAPGATEPEDLVRRSFSFLLEREPRTSILPAFDLPVIERYFAEFERVIRGR